MEASRPRSLRCGCPPRHHHRRRPSPLPEALASPPISSSSLPHRRHRRRREGLNLGGIVRVPGQRQAELRDCKELLDSADAVGVGRAAAEGLQDRRSEDMAERSGHGPGDAPRRVRGHQQRVEGGKTEAAVVNSTHYTSNSLAITAGMLGITEKLNWSSDLIQCSVKPFFGLDLGICSEARTC
ncbi:hypothetical protein B296_00005446 [Ensete ventricosum]|uniref:Uncharacterized protein n=1 Tax=Ensete ventricosum TaxID=4639 RepID=A0A427A8D8_ENSVE|nr:hypothetical protein B296_00005446 [Ensete ventricosum]